MSDKRIKIAKLGVSGMNCTNCALGVKRSLEKAGYKDVSVEFASEEATFSISNEDEIQNAKQIISSLGYKVWENNGKEEKPKGWSSIEKKFWFTAVFTIPLVLAMFLPWGFMHNDIFQLGLTIPVFIVGFSHFGKSAYYSIKSGVTNMDVLIFMGTTAAFVYSLIGTINGLGHDYLFYETSASIISLVLLGNMLEHKAVNKTTSAIDDLISLQKNTAKIITQEMHEGAESIEEVDAALVKKGDKVLVNSGDKIPVDGIVYWGGGSIDESMISGESIPVDKTKGMNVVAGTILVSGNIKVETTASGNKTVLAQIIDMVKTAQKDKPKLQNLADKISSIFVPLVLGIAILTFVGWFFVGSLEFKDALMRSIAVLVIACPCALGLAIPTAVVVGLGRTAKNGILLKGASGFDKLNNINAVVFDKTGTLTSGNFFIRNINSYNYDVEEIKKILYSLEKHSSHPIANAIVKELKGTKEIKVQSVEEIRGVGISASDVEGNLYSVGSFSIANHLTQESNHNIYVIRNNDLIATIDIQDEIKPEAERAIIYLKTRGIKPIMLSGDKELRCKEVADKLGIEEYYSEKMPSEKLEIIDKISLHYKVAMVGDGINDAPALAKAYVGISMSNATQIAVNTAEVVLLKGDLSLMANAFHISGLTQRTIKENLFWAFFYNVASIPLAVIGLLTPIVAAAAMAISDVIVVFNSLRLKRRRRKIK
ncbi:MAG: cadmium-translocating P-type ATPase [Bacteroidetes bacterium]|nr:cadmium-translocating P-type ATPase [Bacteroidota bacterium]